MNGNEEIDAFKKLNLSVIASAYGYQVVDKYSKKNGLTKMSNGSEHIFIDQKGGVYVFWNVDGVKKGTVCDFVAHERNYFLGGKLDWRRVCEELRPYLGSQHFQSVQEKYQGNFAPVIQNSKPRVVDYQGVADRYAHFLPIDQSHPYLCGERGVPFELLQSPRLRHAVRHCPRRGAVVFPNYGCPDGQGSEQRVLVGYEIKGPGGLNRFSKGGSKTLWMSAGSSNDRQIAFVESALDGISYLALHDDKQTRIASISGRMPPHQIEYVSSAIRRMPSGSAVVAAFDNDKAGDGLCEQLQEIVGQINRSDLTFRLDRALQRGHDWNKVLQDQVIAKGLIQRPSLSFER